MANSRFGSILVVMWTAGLATGILGGHTSVAALTRESAEVVAAVDRGIAYLESKDAVLHNMGGKALVATALLKAQVSRDHPRVQDALRAVQQDAARLDKMTSQKYLYEASLALIFLCTLDAEQYHHDITTYVRYLESVQMANGGWTYLGAISRGGDTSIVQHVMLGLWEAHESGISVSPACIERATIWLLKTQGPNGAFGYLGAVSPTFQPVQQSNIHHSVVAAGLGSVYICADLLKLTKSPQEERPDDGLPTAVTKVVDPAEKRETMRSSIDPRLIQLAKQRGAQWCLANDVVDPSVWTYYYYYSAERYWTFREKQDNASSLADRWYDQGARWVISQQKAGGNWEDATRFEASSAIHTSFSILFLLRSTKQTYEQARGLGAGVLVGGRGLPKETESVAMRGGQVISTADLDTLQKMLSQLEDSNDVDPAALEQLAELPAEDLRVEVNKHEARLKELAGSGSPQARLAAVRALARARSFETVPLLIFALTDPDPDVIIAARDGLRRISLKFDGFGLSDQPTEPELLAAVRKWKDWYLAVRPDATFED